MKRHPESAAAVATAAGMNPGPAIGMQLTAAAGMNPGPAVGMQLTAAAGMLLQMLQFVPGS